MNLEAKITFVKGYIAHPYWPAREKLINVQKESGVNRVRSEEKRGKVLRDYLQSKGMTMEDYEKLGEDANRPFYTGTEAQVMEVGHDKQEIIIPSHQIYGALVQTAFVASSSIRICKPEQVRTVLHVSDVWTGKRKEDGVWDRFVVVKTGTGNKLSNQRALRSNPYLGPFTAPISFTFDEEVLGAAKVKEFVSYTGREIGIGASRKLGWGRFKVEFN